MIWWGTVRYSSQYSSQCGKCQCIRGNDRFVTRSSRSQWCRCHRQVYNHEIMVQLVSVVGATRQVYIHVLVTQSVMQVSFRQVCVTPWYGRLDEYRIG